jgi:hypothetical protein
VTLFSIGDQAELDAIQKALAAPPKPAQAPSTVTPRRAGGLLGRGAQFGTLCLVEEGGESFHTFEVAR